MEDFELSHMDTDGVGENTFEPCAVPLAEEAVKGHESGDRGVGVETVGLSEAEEKADNLGGFDRLIREIDRPGRARRECF